MTASLPGKRKSPRTYATTWGFQLAHSRRHLIDSVDSAKPLQEHRVAVIEASDFAKLRAVPQFVLYDFAPDFNLPE
jgi:hypothetical protein